MATDETTAKPIPEVELPRSLIFTLDKIPEPWGIKDLESRFVYANSALVKLFNVKSRADIVGKFDHEIASKLTADNAVEFVRQDNQVISMKRDLITLELHPNAVDYPHIVRKLPFFNEDEECVGIIGYSKNLEVCSLNDYVKGSMPGSLILNPPDDLFSERECEILFFRLQGMSAKDISERLCCSTRTVENHLQIVYQKAGVNCLASLKEFCINKDYHRYLPKRFMTKLRINFDKKECQSI
ncbi:helix-turn-helix transcriptional regulator [Candidatus Regiella insecticola]|nr:helix-turn-helix transcriptional regulator [Candidatus Regiella insecticola]